MIELLIAVAAFAGGFLLAPERERLVEVQVAVPVACSVPVPERPTMPTDALALDAPVDEQSRALRAEVELRGGYEDRLLTALQACRKLPAP